MEKDEYKNLEILKFGMNQILDKYNIKNASLTINEALIGYGRNMAYKLISSCYADKFPFKETLELDYPRDWWQHFKKECFPKWLIKYFPVINTILRKDFEFKTFVLYPSLLIVENNYTQIG